MTLEPQLFGPTPEPVNAELRADPLVFGTERLSDCFVDVEIT